MFIHFFLLSLGLDQISKFLAETFGFEVVFNPGISFYWLAWVDPSVLTWVLFFFIIFLAVFFHKLWRQHPVGAGIFFGAAVSNWADRLLWGGVRDWLPVLGVELKNNAADWMIILSLGWLVWHEGVKTHAKGESNTKAREDEAS